MSKLGRTDCFCKLSLQILARAPSIRGLDVVRVHLEHLGEVIYGLIKLAHALKDDTPIESGVHVLGVHLKSCVVVGQGFFKSLCMRPVSALKMEWVGERRGKFAGQSLGELLQALPSQQALLAVRPQHVPKCGRTSRCYFCVLACSS